MSKKIYPGSACRLEFIVEDADGLPVPSLTHSDVSSSAYRNRTNGVQSSATTATVTSSVASTASVSAGQFVTIDSARGHYAIDVASGAAGSTLDYAEAVVTFTAGHTVTPIQHEIDETLYTVNALNDISTTDVNGVLEAYRTNGVASDNDAEILKGDTTQINAVIDSIYLHTIEIGPAGAALTDIPWNPDWDTEIQSEVQDAIEVNHLDHLLAVEYDPASKPGVATALFNELIGSDSGVSQFTANALELGPSGSGGGGGGGCGAIVERSPSDTNPITFTFPVSGATLTGVVSINNGVDTAVAGALAFYRTEENGKHWYTLAYNVTDRPASEGTARYKFSYGTDDAYVTLRVAVSGGSGGNITGDYALSITVTDDTTSDPIENANVRIYRTGADGADSTDADGEVVMGRDAATWTVIISAAGYTTLTTSLVVTADATLSYELSPLVITPSTGDFTTGYLTAYDEEGVAEAGATIYCELHKAPVGDTGFSYDSKVRSILSDSVGLVEIPGLVKGGTYRIWRGTRNSSPTANNLFLIPTTAGSTYELPSHIGRE